MENKEYDSFQTSKPNVHLEVEKNNSRISKRGTSETLAKDEESISLTLSVISIIIGIISIFSLRWLSIIGIIIGIIGLTCKCLRNLSIIGLILNIIALTIYVISVSGYFSF